MRTGLIVGCVLTMACGRLGYGVEPLSESRDAEDGFDARTLVDAGVARDSSPPGLDGARDAPSSDAAPATMDASSGDGGEASDANVDDASMDAAGSDGGEASDANVDDASTDAGPAMDADSDSPPAGAACPADMLRVYSPATLAGPICVDAAETGALPWTEAQRECVARGLHMCGEVEWNEACLAMQDGAPFVDILDGWEWIDTLPAMGQGGKAGWSTCANRSSHQVVDPYAFRCCGDAAY